MLDVKIIPNTVLMLITWGEIQNTGGSPIINITIRYRILDDKNSNGDWKVIQVNPFKVKTIYIDIYLYIYNINITFVIIT